MKLLEKQIEDVFEIFHDKLIEPQLTLLGRQFIFENGRRANLIFEDKAKRKMVVELKRDAVTREDVRQLLEYYGILDNENPRIVLVAPIIPTSLKLSFEHFGIEYIEFSPTKIAKLFKQIEGISKEQIVSTPLLANQSKDENIAFKVNYNDNNWSGVCSPDTALYNCEHRTWYKIQKRNKNNCQSNYYSGEVNLTHSPCHDSIALQELHFYPGHNHDPSSDGEVRQCLSAIKKIAVFTSRAPGEPESERFIFAIAKIKDFMELPEDNTYEIIVCDKNNALIFNEVYRPKYWDYYRNKNNPDRFAWNTGLFRYLDNSTIRIMLSDILTNRRLKKNQKANCQKLLTIFN